MQRPATNSRSVPTGFKHRKGIPAGRFPSANRSFGPRGVSRNSSGHVASAISSSKRRPANKSAPVRIDSPSQRRLSRTPARTGQSILTGADLLAGRRFDDEIALATWPLEFRETPRGPKLRFPEGNRPAGIPLRCLKPVGTERLFVAGRCISTDHDAQASIRVMGTCFATGEAAGRAAAQATCRP